MYQVNIGDKILYYPGSEEAQIYDTELNEEVGLAGEFKFKVPPDNPVYSELSTGKLVTIYKNGEEFWRGEIRDITTDFAKVADVYVVEDLAWLADEFIAPAQITDETYAQRFQTAIAAYNSVRSSTPERQFLAGYITNVTSSNTCNWTTEYEWSILQSLRECICNAVTETGYIRVRRQKESGVLKRYIDIVKLSDYGRTADQPIEYGYNLLNYVKDSDYGNLTNVLIPYGDELEDQEVYEDYAARLQGTIISNADSIAAYGRHARAVIFDGVNTAATLNALAASYLSRYCQPQLTMEVQAVDLAEIETAEAIQIGDSVRIVAKPFAVDQRLYLTQIRRDIQNIDKNSITMSGHVLTGKTLTSQLAGTAKAIEEIPSKWSVLEAAKRNALAMLLDETQGGYVVFEYDSNNQNMEAINICDQKTIDESTKRWRWSQNGFGYMYRTQKTDPWTGPNVAMTMNGAIVADFITTGSLVADVMKGNVIASINAATGSTVIDGGKLSITGIVNGINAGSTTINGGKISTDSITASQIAAGAINTSELAADAVTAAKIKAGAVSTDELAANAVTAAKINVSTLSAISANMGTVNVGGNENGNGTLKVNNASGSNVVTLDRRGIVADSECIAVISGGYIKHHQTDTGTSDQWVFDLGARYCNCQYYKNGEWHWVNGGATEIYKYLEGAYNTSDQRSKTNIEDLDPDFSKELIMQTKPKTFEFIYREGIKQFGMIAQDVEETLKDMGFTDKNGLVDIPDDPDEWMSIEYKQYVPHLINVVQAQQREIEQIKEELNKLKGEMNNG